MHITVLLLLAFMTILLFQFRSTRTALVCGYCDVGKVVCTLALRWFWRSRVGSGLYTLVIFDNEIDSAGSEGLDGMTVDNINLQSSRRSLRLPRYSPRVRVGFRPFAELGCATGAAYFVVQVEFLCVSLRLWCPLRLHCRWP